VVALQTPALQTPLHHPALLVRTVLEALGCRGAGPVLDGAPPRSSIRLIHPGCLKVRTAAVLSRTVAGLRVVLVTNISMVSIGRDRPKSVLACWYQPPCLPTGATPRPQERAEILRPGKSSALLPALRSSSTSDYLAGRLATHWERAARTARRRMRFVPDRGRCRDELRVSSAMSYLTTATNLPPRRPVGVPAHCDHLCSTITTGEPVSGSSALIAVPIGLIIGHTGPRTLYGVGAVTTVLRQRSPNAGVLFLLVLLDGLG